MSHNNSAIICHYIATKSKFKFEDPPFDDSDDDDDVDTQNQIPYLVNPLIPLAHKMFLIF
jgi:hypothetical protein